MKRRAVALVAVVLMVGFYGPGGVALAVPGVGSGNYAWYKPGTTAINGVLEWYVSFTLAGGTTAGSGNGPNWNDPCVKNFGRLPNGWYDTAHERHINNKDTLIKGRVWGLTDKACPAGTVRTELYIHTEETATNGQHCPTNGDDPYCWEGSSDITRAAASRSLTPQG